MFPISGAYPNYPLWGRFTNGVVVYAGTVQVQGGNISGLETIVFTSQPLIGGTGGSGMSVQAPPLQRIYGAIVDATYLTQGSGVVKCCIASGGLPDSISGGRPALSGQIGGALSGLAIPGPAIVLQWYTINASNGGNTNGPYVATSNAVSGMNVGVILFGI